MAKMWRSLSGCRVETSGLLISWNEDELGFESNQTNIIGHG